MYKGRGDIRLDESRWKMEIFLGVGCLGKDLRFGD